MTTDATHLPASPESSSSWKDALSGNARILIIAALVVVLAAVVYSVIATRVQERNQAAQSALYQAQKLVLAETPKIKRPAPPAAVTDPKAPPAAPIEEPDENARIDVDVTMAGSVKALSAVIEAHPRTRPAFDAALLLGDLYQRHGQPAKAAPWYAKAGEMGPDQLARALAHSSQGYAFEEAGQPQEALQAFTRVANSGEPALKGDALLAMARAHQALGDAKQAAATYDQIMAQLPGTEAAKAAETLKLQLGGAK